ncbi:MAG: stage III sporulation protein AF [Peptococcaceae bacterium]|nr:stage III sporulation protein AF [Peptococcaceae bacterium]
MELIRTVMLNVIVMVFLTTILDLLLPDGNMRRYVKMIMGFFVVLTLLQPVMNVLQPDGMLQQWHLAIENTTENVMPAQGDFSEQAQQMDLMYQETLQKQITSLLLLSTELEHFTVDCTLEERTLQQICITVEQDENVNTARIAQAVSGYYGLDAEKVVIIYKGAESGELE